MVALVMLAFDLAMLVWAFTRPMGDRAGRDRRRLGIPEHHAARGVDAAALASHQRSRGAGRDRDRSRRRGDSGRE